MVVGTGLVKTIDPSIFDRRSKLFYLTFVSITHRIFPFDTIVYDILMISEPIWFFQRPWQERRERLKRHFLHNQQLLDTAFII